MATKTLLEIRTEARALGIENYSKYSKEELEKMINDRTKAESVEEKTEEEMAEEVEVAEKIAAGEVEEITAAQAEELTPEGKKKLSPEEKLAARKAAKEAEKKAKEEEKEAKKKAKEEEKAAKKAAKAAAKSEKKPSTKTPVAVLNLKAKGAKPEFRADTSSRIYDELEKNDGRSYGTIARDLGSHYNMVRRIAETHFLPVDAPETPTAPVQESPETGETTAETVE